MRYETCHFTTLHDAELYHSDYGFSAADVRRKVAEKEIFIGPPKVKEGQKYGIIYSEGRYFIEE